jgi:hypothetical protein
MNDEYRVGGYVLVENGIRGLTNNGEVRLELGFQAFYFGVYKFLVHNNTN